MLDLGYSSKLNAEWPFLVMLRTSRHSRGLPATAWQRSRPSLSFDLAALLENVTGEPDRHPRRSCVLVFFAFRGSERAAAGAGLGAIGRAVQRRAVAGALDTNLHGRHQFLAQFFPLFLLGAMFGKLIEDSSSVAAIAEGMRQRLGEQQAVLAVVLAGANRHLWWGIAVRCFLFSWCRWLQTLRRFFALYHLLAQFLLFYFHGSQPDRAGILQTQNGNAQGRGPHR